MYQNVSFFEDPRFTSSVSCWCKQIWVLGHGTRGWWHGPRIVLSNPLGTWQSTPHSRASHAVHPHSHGDVSWRFMLNMIHTWMMWSPMEDSKQKVRRSGADLCHNWLSLNLDHGMMERSSKLDPISPSWKTLYYIMFQTKRGKISSTWPWVATSSVPDPIFIHNNSPLLQYDFVTAWTRIFQIAWKILHWAVVTRSMFSTSTFDRILLCGQLDIVRHHKIRIL